MTLFNALPSGAPPTAALVYTADWRSKVEFGVTRAIYSR